MMTIVLSIGCRISITITNAPNPQGSPRDQVDEAHTPSSRTNFKNTYIVCLH